MSRLRFGIPGHHPLYQPPLPSPPPGVILGGGKLRPRSSDSGDDEDEEDLSKTIPAARPRRRRPRQTSSRTASSATITPPSPVNSVYEPPTPLARRAFTVPTSEIPRPVPPSISDIIKTHAPPEAQVRSRPPMSRASTLYTHSQGHGTVHEEQESEPEPLTADEEAEMVSRSSIDSIAHEVRQTLKNQKILKITGPQLQHAHSFPTRHVSGRCSISDNASVSSPRSEAGGESSIYCSSAPSSHYPSSPLDSPTFLGLKPPTPSQAVAQYLRSARLTTLLKLTRSPHASHDNPLTVSLSDLGSPTGYPLVVFLGLGCVRHIMGLYDEMAECLNLRIITIDR